MASLEKAVEAIIQEAMQRGEFDDLPGKGKPIDLTAYFDAPEEVRAAYSILKNAGLVPREVELLREIAELRQVEAALVEEKKRLEIHRQIEKKQVEFSLMMERNHRPAKKR
jgi:hypothetical protein